MNAFQQNRYNRGYKQGHLEGRLAAEYCQPSPAQPPGCRKARNPGLPTRLPYRIPRRLRRPLLKAGTTNTNLSTRGNANRPPNNRPVSHVCRYHTGRLGIATGSTKHRGITFATRPLALRHCRRRAQHSPPHAETAPTRAVRLTTRNFALKAKQPLQAAETPPRSPALTANSCHMPITRRPGNLHGVASSSNRVNPQPARGSVIQRFDAGAATVSAPATPAGRQPGIVF